MSARARIALLALCLALTGAALPQLAGAADFKASIRGKQHLEWSVNGTSGSCEIRRGSGSGATDFTFKSKSPVPIYAGKSRKGLKMTGSIPSTATGTVTGQFSDVAETACDPFVPAEPYIQPASGCGATKFGVRVDLQSRGAFVYVTGPGSPLGPVSLALSGDCPSPLSGSFLSSTDFKACGDGTNLWQRSWGVASSAGEGLFASKLSISAKKLFKTKKRKSATITGRSIVDCNMPSQYSGGVTIKGELKYTLTLKRTR